LTQDFQVHRDTLFSVIRYFYKPQISLIINTWKQRENLQLTNVEGYRRQNQGLIQAESDVQSSIDDMQEQMDDMEWMYKGSKAMQKMSPLAHIQGKV